MNLITYMRAYSVSAFWLLIPGFLLAWAGVYAFACWRDRVRHRAFLKKLGNLGKMP